MADDQLEQARRLFDARRWREAFDAYRPAFEANALGREDLDRLAWSAGLIANDEVFVGALERLHQACIEDREFQQAAYAAFWVGFRLFSVGEPSRATGWIARAERLVEEQCGECAVEGYLLLPSVYHHLSQSDDSAAEGQAHKAAEIGDRYRDKDLIALARSLEGRAHLRQMKVESGLALLDEVMVAAISDELSPLIAGIVYCNVLATCHQIYALDRAREWTSALTRWCERQPQLVTFTGNCLIHRSEIMAFSGEWAAAFKEVLEVSEGASKDADPEVLGDAFYQKAELSRLQGKLDEAEQAYRSASQNGKDPQPGLALLRLAQGRSSDATNAIRRAVSTTQVTWQRARLLPAFIEIMLKAGESEEARTACNEIEEIAESWGSEVLAAIAGHARASIAMADGEHRAAVEPLQNAFLFWQRIGAPYLAARVRRSLADAYRALGDGDGAELEREGARQVFQKLGAFSDLAGLDTAGAPRKPKNAHGLSRRELEVLRLLAKGDTNKAIAKALFVSERTIDRHVSNIFQKIDVSSRAAATAFAYENGLV